MQAGDPITVRSLPEGREIPAKVRSFEGCLAIVELQAAGELVLEQPVKLSGETVVYLGVVRQVEKIPTGGVVWVDLEHRLERSRLLELQSSWADSWGEAGKTH